MKVLVTGATGFLGREVVRLAVEAGHEVVALVRPAADATGAPWTSDGVSVVRGDLRVAGPWTRDLAGIDAVIHLAATLSGDLGAQVAGTVVATETLLAHLDPARLQRFVHISSMVVYDFSAMAPGGLLTETSALEASPTRRGPYTETKLFQERMVRDYCGQHSVRLVVLRPGAVYGPGAAWDFGVALGLGPLNLVYSPSALFPVVHVTDCARAIVASLTANTGEMCAVYNLFGDDLPSFWRFNRLCKAAGARTGIPIPAPWPLVASAAWLVDWFDRRVLGSRLKLPECLTYRRMQARWRPLRYSNDAAKIDLRWTPSVPLADGIGEAVRT